MRISFKTVMKGLLAAGTAVGAGILALQTKKSADADAEYDATLAPIGEEASTEDEKKPEMEELPTAEAEVVPEETKEE